MQGQPFVEVRGANVGDLRPVIIGPCFPKFFDNCTIRGLSLGGFTRSRLLELLNQFLQRETLYPRIDLPQIHQPFLQPPFCQFAVLGVKGMLFSLAAQFLDPVISRVQRVTVEAGKLSIFSITLR
jgi:hypothetical protein